MNVVLTLKNTFSFFFTDKIYGTRYAWLVKLKLQHHKNMYLFSKFSVQINHLMMYFVIFLDNGLSKDVFFLNIPC